MKRILLLVLALGAGVATYLLLADPGVTRPTSGQAAPDAQALRTDPGVTRPISGQAPPTTTPPPRLPAGRSYAFEEEVRDPAWAEEQEREVTLRLRQIVEALPARFEVERIECRRTLCRMSFRAADAGALGKLYGALEAPAGLLGWADHLLLEAVITEDDGRVRTAVVAVFERDPTP